MIEQPETTPHAPHHEPAVVEIGELRSTVLRAARVFAEAILVPTALMAILLHTAGLAAGVATAVGWCLLTISLRWIFGRELPGSLLVGACVLIARAGVALATGSAFVYLLQPALGSGLMALLFLGSAAVGRPVTLRLARDFVTLPDHVLDRREVRRIFTQVALLWGVSRLIDAAMSLGSLRMGLDAGLLSRAVFSPTLTCLAVTTCTVWGWRSMRRHGIVIRLTK